MTTSSAIKAEDQAAPESVARIGDLLARMRLLIGRRIIGRTAVANIAPGLDISHLDVLDAMRRIDGEVTVGAIAEVMRIDPSRGSRLVADLVGRGILKRDASQEDGRRSLVVRTEFGDSLLAEIRAVKRSLLGEVLKDWDESQLESFSFLFEKFISDFETIYLQAEKTQEQRSSSDGL
jgi:DNA-binding MarR family transcriptional regulator